MTFPAEGIQIKRGTCLGYASRLSWEGAGTGLAEMEVRRFDNDCGPEIDGVDDRG